MTVAKLIEELNKLPQDIEICYYGRDTYFPVYDVTVESRLEYDPKSPTKFATIDVKYALIN